MPTSSRTIKPARTARDYRRYCSQLLRTAPTGARACTELMVSTGAGLASGFRHCASNSTPTKSSAWQHRHLEMRREQLQVEFERMLPALSVRLHWRMSSR